MVADRHRAGVAGFVVRGPSGVVIQGGGAGEQMHAVVGHMVDRPGVRIFVMIRDKAGPGVDQNRAITGIEEMAAQVRQGRIVRRGGERDIRGAVPGETRGARVGVVEGVVVLDGVVIGRLQRDAGVAVGEQIIKYRSSTELQNLPNLKKWVLVFAGDACVVNIELE